MKNYYIKIFSIASIITIFILLTSKILVSNSNEVNKKQPNLNGTIKTEKPQKSQLQTAQKDNLRQQLSVLQQDLIKYQKDGNIRQEISTLSSIGIIYNELSKYSKALKYLQLAQNQLNMSNLSAQEKSFIESELLVGLGNIYADQGNYPQVLDITRKIAIIQQSRIGSLGSGIADVERIPDKKQLPKPDIRKDAYTLYMIASTQQKRGKVREALRTAEEVLKMLITVQDKDGEREITNFIKTLRQQL